MSVSLNLQFFTFLFFSINKWMNRFKATCCWEYSIANDGVFGRWHLCDHSAFGWDLLTFNAFLLTGFGTNYVLEAHALENMAVILPDEDFFLSPACCSENFRQLQRKLPIFIPKCFYIKRICLKSSKMRRYELNGIELLKKIFYWRNLRSECSSVNTLFVPALNKIAHNFNIHSIKYGNKIAATANIWQIFIMRNISQCYANKFPFNVW